MADFWASVLTFCQNITEAVGQQLLQDFGQVQATAKADGSLVTRCDRWADQRLCDAIATQFPSHGILSEEMNHIFPDTDWCWIIDPIDGTTNFTRGVPVWAISLGLLYQGTPVFGYIHVPPLGQSFHGFWSAPDHANGAFSQTQPIQTRPDAPSPSQFFSLCARSTAVMSPAFPCKIRMLGSAAYNLLTVAAGITIGAVEATPKIWDIAAVWPIAQAAGATWTPLDTTEPFPLQAKHSYSDHPYPTLLLSQADWLPTFLPIMHRITKSNTITPEQAS